MFCGTGSFKSVDSDQWGGGATASPPSSPCRKKQPRDKNPYAGRGRDKFSALLAELEDRRAKIMAKAGVSTMVRFTCSNSDDWVPIIIKLPDDYTAKVAPAKTTTTTPPPPSPTPASPPPPRDAATGAGQETAPAVAGEEGEETKKKKKEGKERDQAMKGWTRWSMERGSSLWTWAAAALMLLCLVAFGRVFAICCTAVWWYLVPLLAEEDGGSRRSTKKKDYGKRLSSKKHGLHHIHAQHHHHHRQHHHHQDDQVAAASPRSHGHGKRSG